jgi:hypothetical protein
MQARDELNFAQRNSGDDARGEALSWRGGFGLHQSHRIDIALTCTMQHCMRDAERYAQENTIHDPTN